MKLLMKWVGTLLLLAALLAGGLAAAVWWWLGHPLPLRASPVEVSIEPGTPVREVTRLWIEAGIDTPPEWLYQWFRWSGDAKRIRAGSYQVSAGTTPRELLERLVKGDASLESLRLIEGWNLRQVREALRQAPNLRPSTADWSEAELVSALGLSGASAEGWLFPDTYRYSRGVSDLTVMKRAVSLMRQRLNQAWAQHQGDLPVQNPEQLLVLASMVEKETGRASDRGRIAGVFRNRLRIGMPLQSDPTVIYGLGAAFDGNLRKADLQSDTPWNTYTRRGLPPTPIAMPGLESLRAAAQPEATDALYFVARGDGSSVFSASLTEHNQAVNTFQRGAQAAGRGGKVASKHPKPAKTSHHHAKHPA